MSSEQDTQENKLKTDRLLAGGPPGRLGVSGKPINQPGQLNPVQGQGRPVGGGTNPPPKEPSQGYVWDTSSMTSNETMLA